MSFTERARAELAAAEVFRTSAMAAEVSALLRFGATYESVGGNMRFDVALPDAAVANRLVVFLDQLYSVSAEMRGEPEADGKVHVRVAEGADGIIRRLGLVTRGGAAVVGLPPQVISGSVSDAEGAWRGAFLVCGSLAEPGRSNLLEVACPCEEAAMALVGCARRIGFVAKKKETRDTERVYIRDGDSVSALLARLGAHRVRLEWDEGRRRRETLASANRLATFDDANLRRSARAAAAAAARVNRAMDILGEDVPEHLAEAGRLRVKFRGASLEELGKLAEPPITKDAVAGRIRRLLSMADRRARELGIPDTSFAVSES